MTFRIVQTIDPNVVKSIVLDIDERIMPRLIPDVSNYAKGRMRTWLEYEAPLSANQQWRSGVHYPRLWDYLTRICTAHDFVPEVGLISRGGGINRHRDASYADYRAFGLNLGVCKWHYEECYPEFKWTADTPQSAPEQTFELRGGELFEFNCKNPHSVTGVDGNRWGINLWRIAAKERGGFPG